MCATHSVIIDSDKSNYSVEELLDWKRLAENLSHKMVNSRAYTEEEIKSEVSKGSVDLLRQYAVPDGDHSGALVKMVQGIECELQDLDPRFDVKVAAEGRGVHHWITPKIPGANIQVLISGIEELEKFRRDEQALFDEGRELVIPGGNFKFVGSKLFEAINPKGVDARKAYLTIAGAVRKVSVTLYVRSESGQEIFIESFLANSRGGNVRVIVEGSCLGGALSINGAVNLNGSGARFDLNFNLRAWEGLDVLRIPGFPKVLKSLPCLSKDGYFSIDLELEGRLARLDFSQAAKATGSVDGFCYFSSTVQLARVIAAACDKPIFLLCSEVDGETRNDLAKYAEMINGPVRRKLSDSIEIRSIIGLDQSNGWDPIGVDGPHEFSLADKEGLVIEVFGQKVKTPRRTANYRNIRVAFFCDLDSKDQFGIQIYPEEGAEIEYGLVKGDKWVVL